MPTSKNGSQPINAVERFFAEITSRRIRRGTFSSVTALKRAIRAYVNDHNNTATPFIWTKLELSFGKSTNVTPFMSGHTSSPVRR
jgi:hypothetical protein